MPNPVHVAPALVAALLSATACWFPTGRIEGTVRDRSSTPIANVYVGVVGLAHLERSDTSGRYRLLSVPVGAHRLRATGVGYAPLEQDSVFVHRGVTTRADFTLDRTMDRLQETTAANQDRAPGSWKRLAAVKSLSERALAEVVRAADS
jgi:hypothetical protein